MSLKNLSNMSLIKNNMSLKIAIIKNLCSQKNTKNNNFDCVLGEIAKIYFK